MNARSYLRPLISLLLITLTVLGLLNVYADDSEVQKRAEEVACGGQLCTTRLVQLERTVIAQTFTFDTRGETAGSGRTAVVKCRREFIFAGGYGCEAQ